MSASLVGSEMCIRDRAWPDRPPRRVATVSQLRRSLGARRPSQSIRAQPCLLYTSDAADDM
eukprot:8424638-Alexandrium_andersonii.AAC.1